MKALPVTPDVLRQAVEVHNRLYDESGDRESETGKPRISVYNSRVGMDDRDSARLAMHAINQHCGPSGGADVLARTIKRDHEQEKVDDASPDATPGKVGVAYLEGFQLGLMAGRVTMGWSFEEGVKSVDPDDHS